MGGGVRRTQYWWNWEWGIKGGRGETQDRGLGGSGGLGKGARSTGRTGGDRVDATHAIPVERGGGRGG